MAQTTKTYEGMFLLDAGNPDFQAACEPVQTILSRNEVEVLAIKPWDERKLAYEIARRKRGLYVLVYFKSDPLRIAEIEHDCQLDERVVRVLILRRDQLTEQELQAETPATSTVRRPAEGEGERDERPSRDNGDDSSDSNDADSDKD